MSGDLFDRNLERLIGRAAVRASPEEARRRFLSALEPRMSWRIPVMVASMIAAALVWAFLPTQEPEPEKPSDPVVRPEESTGPAPAPAPTPLAVKAPLLRDPQPILKVEGPVDLPDGTEVIILLSRRRETLAGGRLVPLAIEAGASTGFAKGKKFKAEMAWSGPGEYLVSVGLFGGPAKGLVQYTLAGWGDDAIGRASERLPEIGAVAKEALDLILRLEAACVSKIAWERQKKNLTDETRALLARLDRMEAARYYSAAHEQIWYSLFNIAGSVEYFAWKEGAVSVETYHANREPVKTFRGDAFSFETFRKYVEEAVPAAGRELALWAVRDLRRAGPRPAVAEALRLHAAHAGLSDFAERLGKAAPEELDGLEKAIRR